MASVRAIIRNNNATFYNYRTGQKIKIWPRFLLFFFISPIIAFLLSENLTDFINSINTIASIILGFAFSVLFYIAAAGEAESGINPTLEQRNRTGRLQKLSKELFHNVSYFVLVASIGLALAMLVIAPESKNKWIDAQLVPWIARQNVDVEYYMNALVLIIRSAYFFLLIEASYTFARIVARVNYLFDARLRNGKS